MTAKAKMQKDLVCIICTKSDPPPENHVFHGEIEVWYGGFSYHSKCFDHNKLAAWK